MQKPARTSVAPLLATLSALLLLAGCGQKGPLALPAPPTATTAASAPGR